MADSADHPSRSLIWALVESGGLSLLSLAVLIVVARLTGPLELGAFALALGVVQVLALIVEMLVHDAIIQRPQLTPAHLHTAFWTCLSLGFALSGLCWFAAPAIGNLFDNQQVSTLVSIAGLSLAFSGAGSVPIALLRREMRFKPLAVRSLCGRLAGAIVAVAMVVGGYGVWALVAQHLIQIAIATVLVWPASSWRPAMVFSFRCLRDLVSFGALSVGTRLIWLAGGRIFTLLIGNFLGVAAVGYLNIAQRLVDTLFDVLAGAAHNLALPIFSRRQADRPTLVRTYSQAAEFTAMTTVPMFGGLALCASPLIAALLGEAWLPSAPVVWVLALGAMMQFVFLFGPTTLTALGRPGIVFVLSFATLLAMLVALFLWQPADVVPAAALWVSRILVGGPVMHWVICRLLNISPWILLRAVWVPLLATSAMAATLIAVESYGLAGASPMMRLVTMIPLGALVYLAVIVLAGRSSLMRLARFGLAAFHKRGASGG